MDIVTKHNNKIVVPSHRLEFMFQRNVTPKIKELTERLENMGAAVEDYFIKINDKPLTFFITLKGLALAMPYVHSGLEEAVRLLEEFDDISTNPALTKEARIYIHFNKLKKDNYEKACGFLFAAYNHICFTDDGRQIRGAWSKLYKSLGICRATAVSYREAARLAFEDSIEHLHYTDGADEYKNLIS